MLFYFNWMLDPKTFCGFKITILDMLFLAKYERQLPFLVAWISSVMASRPQSKEPLDSNNIAGWILSLLTLPKFYKGHWAAKSFFLAYKVSSSHLFCLAVHNMVSLSMGTEWSANLESAGGGSRVWPFAWGMAFTWPIWRSSQAGEHLIWWPGCLP